MRGEMIRESGKGETMAFCSSIDPFIARVFARVAEHCPTALLVRIDNVGVGLQQDSCVANAVFVHDSNSAKQPRKLPTG